LDIIEGEGANTRASPAAVGGTWWGSRDTRIAGELYFIVSQTGDLRGALKSFSKGGVDVLRNNGFGKC